MKELLKLLSIALAISTSATYAVISSGHKADAANSTEGKVADADVKAKHADDKANHEAADADAKGDADAKAEKKTEHKADDADAKTPCLCQILRGSYFRPRQELSRTQAAGRLAPRHVSSSRWSHGRRSPRWMETDGVRRLHVCPISDRNEPIHRSCPQRPKRTRQGCYPASCV